jgi:hypothetical protein
MTDIEELPFRTISNSGRMDGLSYQCMFISIYQYLKLVKSNNSVTVSKIRNIGGLGSDTSNTMYDFQDRRFDGCLDNICDHFNIKIKIYYSNRRSDEKTIWIGKCQWKFGNSKSSIARIVSLIDHFELITNIGDKEYISENLINPKTNKTIIPDTDIKSKSSIDSKSRNHAISAYNISIKQSIDRQILSIINECLENKNIIDDIDKQNSLILHEIEKLKKEFTDKKVNLVDNKDVNKDVTKENRKALKEELISIKELIEKNIQVIEYNNKYAKKLGELNNANMEIVHKLETTDFV